MASAPAPHGQFSGKLVLVLLLNRDRPSIRDGRSLWALQRPLSYRTVAGDTITVPAGMVTDLASIPRPFWSLFPADGPWTQAAVIHDFLYQTEGAGIWKRHPSGLSRERPYTRQEADDTLLQAMADLGVPWLQRRIIWAAVRLGGRAGWGH